MVTVTLAGILARCLRTGPQAKYGVPGCYAWYCIKLFITSLRVGLYIAAMGMMSFMTMRVHRSADMGSNKGQYGFT